ncbi:hypothetical protein K443DRAFT_490627 [Laccaria amethystina LaAM-08-1]|uniref:Uncharacterized protein n=1 Tax=Laccaria amethystina LaAM-08-1 TaxID=1095629 RepID=A0A0C9XNJ7_9AGAR|nr:hypothetical protein K443DRAFT_490627 [Laccaria amethystina LaAM-08-1]
MNQSKHISSLFRRGSLDNSRRSPKIQQAEHGHGQEKSAHEITGGVPSSSIRLQPNRYIMITLYLHNSITFSTQLHHAQYNSPHGQTCPDRLELTRKRGTTGSVDFPGHSPPPLLTFRWSGPS